MLVRFRNVLAILFVALAGVKTGYLIFGWNGVLGGLAAVFFWVLFSVRVYPFFLLRAYHACLVDISDAPEIEAILKKLSKRAHLPVPKLYWIPVLSPHLFSFLKWNAESGMVVTQGLLDLLNKEELEGVMAHEMAHLERKDAWVSGVVFMTAALFWNVRNFFQWVFLISGEPPHPGRQNPLVWVLTSILRPMIALFVCVLIPRSVEYDADKRGAELSGNPLYLASALQKMDVEIRKVAIRIDPGTSSHFLIMQPQVLKGIGRLLDPHPVMEERILRLEAMNPASNLRVSDSPQK